MKIGFFQCIPAPQTQYVTKKLFTDCILRSWLLQNTFINIVLHSELNPNPKYLAPYHFILYFSHYFF